MKRTKVGLATVLLVVLLTTVSAAEPAGEGCPKSAAYFELPCLLPTVVSAAPATTTLAPAVTTSTWTQPEWLGPKIGTGGWIATGALAGGWLALGLEGDVDTIQDVGDITQLIPGATGLGMALGTKDWKGARQWTWSLLLSGGTVNLLKATNEKYRPDATNLESFPSGHTQGSFFGAGYMLQRYGPKWGIPAMMLGAYTGYSRVQGQKHFADDVISGMSIALFSTWLLVEPADPERAARWRDLQRPRNYRFEWENADGKVLRNDVRVPKVEGTLLDFQLDEVADPQITASVGFDVRLGRHNIRTRFTPFEIRDVGTLSEDVRFGDTILPAGTEVASIYYLGDVRTRYAYELLPDSPFHVDLGGGLGWFDTLVQLFPDPGTSDPDLSEAERAEATASGFLPLLYGRLGYDCTRLIGIYGEVDFVDLSNSRFLDWTARLTFQINAAWDVSVGWRRVESDLDIDRVRNEVQREGFLTQIGYSF